MSRSYLLYTDHLDAGKAKLYVEMGQVQAVPERAAFVTVDAVEYRVVDVYWNVYSKPELEEGTYPVDYYPQQCATVLLRRTK